MGVRITLDIIPEEIDDDEWESVYEETLLLLQEYDFMDEIVDEEKYDYKWSYTTRSKEREFASYDNRLGWYTFGDMTTMKSAEDFMLLRDLSYYDRFREESDCDDILISRINWQSQMSEEIQNLTVGKINVFDAKTQGYPYHMYILAIACLIESRFPQYAYVNGDVTKAQMKKSIEWVNSILKKPVNLTERANNEKLLKRLEKQLEGEYSKLQAFFDLTINQEDKELGDFVRNHFTTAAVRKYYTAKMNSYEIGQIGFGNYLENYLELGFDLEMLCDICILDDDGCKYDAAAFVERVFKFINKNEKTKDGGVNLDINDADSEAPETIDSLFGKTFLKMSGLSNSVKIDISSEEAKEVFKKKLHHLCNLEEIYNEVVSSDDEVEINNEMLEMMEEMKNESQKQEYDIEDLDGLMLWEPGETIHPKVEKILTKIKDFVEDSVSKHDMIFEDYSKLDRMRLLMQNNRYFYLSKNTWEFIEKNIDKQYIYDRVLGLFTIKATNESINKTCKAILNNLELFNYLWERNQE